MTARAWLGALVAVILCACTSSRRAEQPPQIRAGAAQAPRPIEVRWFGALHAIMHEGRTEATVKLADVVPGPHAWGLGALAGLGGEVTIVDDVPWLAIPESAGTARVRPAQLGKEDRGQGAALLVVANIARWDELPLTADVPWDRLGDFVAGILRARHAGTGSPVALRFEGAVEALRWHVVDGSRLAPGSSHADHARTAVSGVASSPNARLVGFFSTEHQGVFTHAGQLLHLHVLIEEPLLSGHVDAVDLKRGARLLVAAP